MLIATDRQEEATEPVLAAETRFVELAVAEHDSVNAE